MNNIVIKKQFILDRASSGDLRRIQIALAKEFGSENVMVNFERKQIIISFNTEANIVKVMEIIEDIDDDIDVEVKDVKPAVRKVFILENLDCANCAAKIERIAKRTFDNEFIVVDFATTRFIIETTNEAQLKTLQGELQDIASSVDPNITVKPNTAKRTERNTEFRIDPKRKKEFFIGASIFLVGFIVKTILLLLHVEDWIRWIIVYLTYIPGYYLLARDVLYGAFKNVVNGRVFDEKFLMSLATITALIIGYYDEAIFVMVFFKLGELCQQYAVNYSRKSIASLIDIQPQIASVESNGTIIEVSPEEVVVGDIIAVKPGERVPLDGEVVSGNAALDVSALTGESEPIMVNPGSKIMSGSICQDEIIKVKVTKTIDDSMVSKILNLVENASSKKAKSENFITRFARYYTPIVVALALLLAIFLPFFDGINNITWTSYKESLRVAMIFLVVSCPCALVISIPLGFFGGIGAASKSGILIKGSNYLELLESVSTIVFDKTGTLTTGEFVVEEVVAMNDNLVDEVVYYSAHAESTSTHPIAKSILDYYASLNRTLNYNAVVAQKVTSNRGITALVDGKKVSIGRIDYLKSEGIELPNEVKMMSNLFIAVDGKIIGYYIFEDKVKEEAKEAIKQLRQLGVKKMVMITGDTKKIASKVSKELELDEFYAEVSPVGKVDKLLEIKEKLPEGEHIAYVGDGINDAPVLSSADVGIAMGGLGSDAAIEVADAVLMSDEITKIVDMIEIARMTKKIIIQNIVFSLAVKIIFMIIAPLGLEINGHSLNFLLIYEAVFADVGVTLIAILNSLRIIKYKKKEDK